MRNCALLDGTHSLTSSADFNSRKFTFLPKLKLYNLYMF